MPNAPILLFQWLAPGDHDELVAIRDGARNELANHASPEIQIPDIDVHICRALDGPKMLAELCEFLKSNPDAQVLYFGAHGETDRNFINKQNGSVSFNYFGDCLRKCLDGRDVSLVLGACHAIACGIENSLPQKVRWVWGFACEPSQEDVISLMAAVIEDVALLQQRMHEANQSYSAAINAAKETGSSVNAEDYFGPELDAYSPDIAKWFNHPNKNRGPLWMMERDGSNKEKWSNPNRFA